MKPLRSANPPVIPYDQLDDFMDEVFSNILDIRECNRRLLEVLAVRQREQYPIIQKIGDIFLHTAAQFRMTYPLYVGNIPAAEKRWKDELEHNAEFRRWLEVCISTNLFYTSDISTLSQHRERHPDARRLDLKSFLNRPSEHLTKYPVLLEAILKETSDGNPDAEFLVEAMQAINKLSVFTQLRTFQTAMGKGPTGRFEWYNLVPADELTTISKQERKRQSYVRDLSSSANF